MAVHKVNFETLVLVRYTDIILQRSGIHIGYVHVSLDALASVWDASTWVWDAFDTMLDTSVSYEV